MIINAEIVPIQTKVFSIELAAKEGRSFPSKKDLKNILNENLEPHLKIAVRSMYVEGKSC